MRSGYCRIRYPPLCDTVYFLASLECRFTESTLARIHGVNRPGLFGIRPGLWNSFSRLYGAAGLEDCRLVDYG